MNTIEISANVFKGRLGYYATSYETYLKLKKMKKWYWETVKIEAASRRWNRKQPENRSGPEPKVCPHLYSVTKGYTRYGSEVKHLDRSFIEIYDKIRMPALTPETVPIIPDCDMERFETQYQQAEIWFAEQV